MGIPETITLQPQTYTVKFKLRRRSYSPEQWQALGERWVRRWATRNGCLWSYVHWDDEIHYPPRPFISLHWDAAKAPHEFAGQHVPEMTPEEMMAGINKALNQPLDKKPG